MADAFDPTKLDTRWHGSQSSDALTHPLMKGIDRSMDLGAAATELMAELRRECLTLGNRDTYGPERTVVIREILNSLETAVAKEVEDWRERTAPGADVEKSQEAEPTEEEAPTLSAEDSENSQGSGNAETADDAEEEAEDEPDEGEDDDFVSDLDHYSRLVTDLEGLLEIYLR